MNHKIRTEKFTLELEAEIYDSDIYDPEDSSLIVRVESNRFGAFAVFNVDIGMFLVFVSDLRRLYTSLIGSAKIEQPYGPQNHIEFSGRGNGYITVEGVLSSIDRNDCEQKLEFRNEFDQTYLKDFATELFLEYKHYLPLQ